MERLNYQGVRKKEYEERLIWGAFDWINCIIGMVNLFYHTKHTWPSAPYWIKSHYFSLKNIYIYIGCYDVEVGGEGVNKYGVFYGPYCIPMGQYTGIVIVP